MNANNYTNDSLIKYSTILSFLILFNYFLWSINAWQIIREVNFIFLLLTFIFFFVSKKYNNYWYVKIIILLLLIICLGSPTIDADSRSLYLFSSKILYYESNLYFRLDSNNNVINYFNDIVYSKPKLSITLTATLAQLLGYWNEIYPKSTNIIIILPPIIVLISFFKDKIFILFWLFLMLFFSGRLLINGLMDGIIGLYFVSCTLISYKILTTKKESEKLLFYLTLFIFFAILSLSKNEGGVMVLVIFLSSFLIDFIYERKVNIKLFFTTVIALCPIGLWKYMFIKNNIKMEFLQNGDPINKFLTRITNSEDLINIISFLANNEKLLISILIFTFVSYKFFNDNKKLIFLISLNFLIYFLALIVAILLTPHTVYIQLLHSSSRIFIPLVLMLSYFSVFLVYENLKKKIN
jgi:hypothetical protein